MRLELFNFDQTLDLPMGHPLKVTPAMHASEAKHMETPHAQKT